MRAERRMLRLMTCEFLRGFSRFSGFCLKTGLHFLKILLRLR